MVQHSRKWFTVYFCKLCYCDTNSCSLYLISLSVAGIWLSSHSDHHFICVSNPSLKLIQSHYCWSFSTPDWIITQENTERQLEHIYRNTTCLLINRLCVTQLTVSWSWISPVAERCTPSTRTTRASWASTRATPSSSPVRLTPTGSRGSSGADRGSFPSPTWMCWFLCRYRDDRHAHWAQIQSGPLCLDSDTVFIILVCDQEVKMWRYKTKTQW